MKFDVIIGNPPYINDSFSSIYQYFVLSSMEHGAKYISWIIPSKWAFGTGKGKYLTSGKDSLAYKFFNKWSIKFFKVENTYSIFEKISQICIITIDNTFCHDKINHIVLSNGIHFYIDESHSSIINKIKEKNLEPFSKCVNDKTKKSYPSSQGIIDGPNRRLFIPSTIKEDNEISLYRMEPDEEYKHKVYVSVSTSGKKKLKENHLSYVFVKNDIYELLKEKYSDSHISKKTILFSSTCCQFKGLVDGFNAAYIADENSIIANEYITAGHFDKERDDIEIGNMLKYLKTKFSNYIIGMTLENRHMNKDNLFFLPLMNDYHLEWTDERINNYFGFSEEEINKINHFWSEKRFKNNTRSLDDRFAESFGEDVYATQHLNSNDDEVLYEDVQDLPFKTKEAVLDYLMDRVQEELFLSKKRQNEAYNLIKEMYRKYTIVAMNNVFASNKYGCEESIGYLVEHIADHFQIDRYDDAY